MKKHRLWVRSDGVRTYEMDPSDWMIEGSTADLLDLARAWWGHAPGPQSGRNQAHALLRTANIVIDHTLDPDEMRLLDDGQGWYHEGDRVRIVAFRNDCDSVSLVVDLRSTCRPDDGNRIDVQHIENYPNACYEVDSWRENFLDLPATILDRIEMELRGRERAGAA